PAELLVLSLEHLVATPGIDPALLRGRHEPSAGLVGNARLGPLLECGDERILSKLLRNADVADDPREPGDESCRFDLLDRVNRLVGFGSPGTHPPSSVSPSWLAMTTTYPSGSRSHISRCRAAELMCGSFTTTARNVSARSTAASKFAISNQSNIPCPCGA